MRRGILVHNPMAGGRWAGRVREAVLSRARSAGLDLEPIATRWPGDATAIVRERLAAGPDVVAVWGGDGTVAEAAAALVGCETPLAILPAGTTNVIAREYGLGLTPAAAEAGLHSLSHRPIAAWPVAGRVSLIGVGIGYDAIVMKHTVPWLKRRFGRAGIGWTAVREWIRYANPAIEVVARTPQGERIEREATLVISANTRCYGGSHVLSPGADPESDTLDLILVRSRSRTDLFRFFALLGLGGGRHLSLPFVERHTVLSFEARVRGGPQTDFQVDGDALGQTPLSVGPVAGTVRIRVPEGKTR